MPEEVHGVAHISVSASAFNPREFYAVIFHGVLQPEQHSSWRDAHLQIERMEKQQWGAAA